jgi:hypothetical protein
MKQARPFVVNALISDLISVVPVYPAVLLLLKAMGSERLERSLFSRLPGFALLRSLTQQLTGQGQEKVWKPALVEVEELEDGRVTVFVPSVPTPLATTRLSATLSHRRRAE